VSRVPSSRRRGKSKKLGVSTMPDSKATAQERPSMRCSCNAPWASKDRARGRLPIRSRPQGQRTTVAGTSKAR